MLPDIFISYTQEDRTVAEELCRVLESSGLGCWIAPRNIEAGTDWTNGIMQAIDGCCCLVLVFSSSANKSDHVRREILHAIEKERRIFPFRIENVAAEGGLGYCLKGLHWFDATVPPMEKNMAALSAQLLQTVMNGKSSERVPGGDIHFECPGCQQRLVVNAADGGREAPCPACQQTLVIPLHSTLDHASAPTPRAAPAVPAPSASAAPPLFDTAVITHLKSFLAEFIGPIAFTLVERAAAGCRSHSELLETLAAELDSPKDREHFLRVATSRSARA
jgi:hypothetical protein